jgi:hypothetical protein
LNGNAFRLVRPIRQHAVDPAPATGSFVPAALPALHLDPEPGPTAHQPGQRRGPTSRNDIGSHLYGRPQHR